jgi:SAM-dependent methyltransferase
MKALDRFLQQIRMRKAAAECRQLTTILDIGCSQGEFQAMIPHEAIYLGIDPDAPSGSPILLRGYFPDDFGGEIGGRTFDGIVALAVVEHLESAERMKFFRAALSLLSFGGKLILTVPGPKVDQVLDLLVKFRLIDGMDLDHHHGASIKDIQHDAIAAGFSMMKHQRFELGLNHLFVFTKT